MPHSQLQQVARCTCTRLDLPRARHMIGMQVGVNGILELQRGGNQW
jgi:hypothetical protein